MPRKTIKTFELGGITVDYLKIRISELLRDGSIRDKTKAIDRHREKMIYWQNDVKSLMTKL